MAIKIAEKVDILIFLLQWKMLSKLHLLPKETNTIGTKFKLPKHTNVYTSSLQDTTAHKQDSWELLFNYWSQITVDWSRIVKMISLDVFFIQYFILYGTPWVLRYCLVAFDSSSTSFTETRTRIIELFSP